VVRRHDFLPFGEELPAGLNGRSAKYAPAEEPLFTGKIRDAETGLDYFGARYLSAPQGRFTGADAPFADQTAGDPQSWNLYGYVRNNPLVFVDEIGEAIKYASARLEVYSNTMRVRSSTYDKALTGFEGPGAPDITFQFGDAGMDADGISKAIGLASAYISPGSTIFGTPDNPDVVISLPPKLKAATVTIDTSISESKSQVKGTLAHEVGHANDARTSTVQYLRDSKRTKESRGAVQHDRRPEERRANSFRDRVNKERKRFGKRNKQQNRHLMDTEKQRIKELEKLGVQ